MPEKWKFFDKIKEEIEYLDALTSSDPELAKKIMRRIKEQKQKENKALKQTDLDLDKIK